MAENRVTTGALETLHSGNANARVSTGGLQVLHKGAASARVSSAALQVLRSVADGTPEVTFSASLSIGFDIGEPPITTEFFLSAALTVGFDITADVVSSPPFINLSASLSMGFDLESIITYDKLLSATLPIGFDIGADASSIPPDPCGLSSGDRTARITVTTDLITFEGTPDNLVDGDVSYPTGAENSGLGMNINDLDLDTPYVEFEFDMPLTLISLQLIQSSADQQGTWKMQYWDGGSWVDYGATFFIAADTDQTFIRTSPAASTRYRMQSTAGVMNAVNYWLEINFQSVECEGEFVLNFSASMDIGFDIDAVPRAIRIAPVQSIIVVSGR